MAQKAKKKTTSAREKFKGRNACRKGKKGEKISTSQSHSSRSLVNERCREFLREKKGGGKKGDHLHLQTTDKATDFLERPLLKTLREGGKKKKQTASFLKPSWRGGGEVFARSFH